MVQSSPPVAFMTGMCVRVQRGEEIRNKVQGCQDKGAFNACSVRGIIQASLNAKRLMPNETHYFPCHDHNVLFCSSQRGHGMAQQHRGHLLLKKCDY